MQKKFLEIYCLCREVIAINAREIPGGTLTEFSAWTLREISQGTHRIILDRTPEDILVEIPEWAPWAISAETSVETRTLLIRKCLQELLEEFIKYISKNVLK